MALLLGLTGCSSLFGLGEPGHPPDAASGVDPADARLCWGTELSICLSASPTERIALSGALDTAVDAHCRSEIVPYCVIAATEVTVPAGTTLDVSGPRPLVLVATQQLAVGGVLDAASHAATGKAGPGALAVACNPFLASPSAHGGGAGGSFAGQGGTGAGNEVPAADTGGAPALPLGAIGLRAGCPGQNGGTVTGAFGLGGSGGGALYLVAGTEIAIANRVTASGAAGRGGECTPTPCKDANGADANGGGGGGSGGTIVLDAPTVSLAPPGAVLADGGGGGEGASHSENGADGSEPADGVLPAPGGANNAKHGGDGGDGAHAVTLAGSAGAFGTSSSPGGGGGGGGGAGAIRLRQATSIVFVGAGGVVSPPVGP